MKHMHPDNAEKHNAVIRKIHEIPPWERGGEFLELEPQVLRFLDTFALQKHLLKI